MGATWSKERILGRFRSFRGVHGRGDVSMAYGDIHRSRGRSGSFLGRGRRVFRVLPSAQSFLARSYRSTALRMWYETLVRHSVLCVTPKPVSNSTHAGLRKIYKQLLRSFCYDSGILTHQPSPLRTEVVKAYVGKPRLLLDRALQEPLVSYAAEFSDPT